MTWREGLAGEWRITSAALFAVISVGKPVDVAAISAGGVKPAAPAVELELVVARRTRGISTRKHDQTRLDLLKAALHCN